MATTHDEYTETDETYIRARDNEEIHQLEELLCMANALAMACERFVLQKRKKTIYKGGSHIAESPPPEVLEQMRLAHHLGVSYRRLAKRFGYSPYLIRRFLEN
jgi:hypothetical protein